MTAKTAKKTAPKTAPKRETLTPEQRYGMWLVTCADTPDKLRTCDLDRALDEASAGGDLPGFARWLMGQRPDLTVTIATALVSRTAAPAPAAPQVAPETPAETEAETAEEPETEGELVAVDESRWPAGMSFRDDRWRDDPAMLPARRLAAWIAAAFPRHMLRLSKSIVPDRNTCVIEAAPDTDDNAKVKWTTVAFVRKNPSLAMSQSPNLPEDQDITTPAGLTKILQATAEHLRCKAEPLPEPGAFVSVTTGTDGTVTVSGPARAAVPVAAAIADGAPVPPAGMTPGQKAAWTRKHGKPAAAAAPAPTPRVDAPAAPVAPETIAVVDFPAGVDAEAIWKAIDQVTGDPDRTRAWNGLNGDEKRAVLAILKGEAPPAPAAAPVAEPAIAAMVSAGPGYIVRATDGGYLALAFVRETGGYRCLTPNGEPRSIAGCLHYIANDLKALTKAPRPVQPAAPLEEVQVTSGRQKPPAPAPQPTPKPGSAPVPSSVRDTMPAGLTAGQKAAWTRRMKALNGATAH